MIFEREIERLCRIVRACKAMRDACTDPAEMEILRAAENRAVDQLHALLRTMNDDDLYRRCGIEMLAKEQAAHAAQAAVAKALEVVDVPPEVVPNGNIEIVAEVASEHTERTHT